MGNTWAHYYSFQAAPFERNFFAFPRTMARGRWRHDLKLAQEHRTWLELTRHTEAAVQRALAQGQIRNPGDPSEIDLYRGRMAAALRPSVERSVAIDFSEYIPEETEAEETEDSPEETEKDGASPGDEASISLEFTGGGRGILAHCAHACGVGQLRESDIIHDLWCDFPPVGAQGSPARAAFDAFLGVLGYHGSPSELPWWVRAAYPSDHHAGLASPDQLAGFARLAEHANLREALRAAILQRWGREQPRFGGVLDFIHAPAASSRWLLSIESAS